MVELVEWVFDSLSKSGYGVFWLGHTKSKDKEDVVTGIKYETITNNLEDGLYSAIADKSQMVVNIVNEFEFDNIHFEDNNFTHKKEEKGDIVGQKRMMYFRGNYQVDACCNFRGVPEKLELCASNFLKAFEMGVKAELENGGITTTAKELEKQEDKVNEIKSELQKEKVDNEDSEKKDELISNIKELVKMLMGDVDKKEKLKTLMKNLGIKGFGDMPTLKYSQIKEFYNTIKSI